MKKTAFLLSFFLSVTCLHAEETQVKEGNFSLPLSQQPGPLVGFGENIIEKGKTQFFMFADEYKRKNGYSIDVIPSIVYGIRDDLSLFINLPIAPRYKASGHHSAGLEDAFVQLEYAFYTAIQKSTTDQATIVANVTFPTGSFRKEPPTGAGSPSFFLGTTYSHMGRDWFSFGSLGTIQTTSRGNNKTGNQYLYQTGFGRNIASLHGWIFAWMVEFDGLYTSKTRVRGIIDNNSGGNVVYLTPSLWASSEHVIIQLGAGGILTQHLFGNQSRYTHQIVCNLGWTF